MQVTVVAQITKILDGMAPAYLRFENDKIGLQVGSPNALVDRVLVALEVTDEVLKEARDKGVDLVVSHHPLIYQSLDRVVANDFTGGLVAGLVKSDISLFVAHTNLDRAVGGVSDVLAHVLDLQDIEVLLPAHDIKVYKLVVFVPSENVYELISAMGNAGAGVIGNYSHCSFRSEGIGTFCPMLGAQPYLGKVGELNQANEYRLEMLVSPDRLEPVIRAMIEVHPYEEVAYDVYELKNPPAGVGFGRVGNLAKPRKLRSCTENWSEKLGSTLKVSGDWEMIVKRVAVCGGSGGELIGAAKASGADVFITGDIKYHTAHAARSMGLALIDAGHAETERLVVPKIARDLQTKIDELGLNVEVLISSIDTSPWNRG